MRPLTYLPFFIVRIVAAGVRTILQLQHCEVGWKMCSQCTWLCTFQWRHFHFKLNQPLCTVTRVSASKIRHRCGLICIHTRA